MSRKDEIRNAYRHMGGDHDFYDGMIICSTLSGRLVTRAVWAMSEEENHEYIAKAMQGIPEGFAGKLLEVPVGTGILSMPLYKTLPEADVTCLDYSADMMARAQKRAEGMGLCNVYFQQGDVGALPYEDGSFDTVLSLNGFHAFPDKEAAYRETFRVLAPGGTFCGCFYIAGQHKRTDWFVNHLYVPKGYFTPPFETLKSLRNRLEGMYANVKIETVKGIACFICTKGVTA